MNIQQTLKTFFEEKQLLYKEWNFEVNGTIHFIDNEFVIDLICNYSSLLEQSKILDTIIMIDFKNGDINHFLEHLAKGYLMTNYSK